MHAKELTTDLLVQAYARGYFPMPDPDTEEVLWFRPDPRAVIPLDGFHVSRSLAKVLKRKDYEVKRNQNFIGVMKACGKRDETWIIPEFIEAYSQLHDAELAHSLEIYRGKKMIGGVYGVQLGGAFFAESMFHAETDASKVALFHLVDHLRAQKFELLECQFLTPHLKSLGAVEIPDTRYVRRLSKAIQIPAEF